MRTDKPGMPALDTGEAKRMSNRWRVASLSASWVGIVAAFALTAGAAEPSPAQPPPETPAFPADPPSTWLTYHLAHPGTTAPGDPNGAFYWKGRYHLHYIYEAKDGVSWAHVSSTDMVHWKWHPTTLTPATMGHGLFSGTGFVTKEGKPAIIYHGEEKSGRLPVFAESCDK